ncbi:MAG: hypothetical protein ACKPHM_02205 [Dolichospermum sp.]
MQITALPGVMRYISSGQDARTTRVLLLISVPHQSGKGCIIDYTDKTHRIYN